MWRIPLVIGRALATSLYATLSSDERERAARLHDRRQRNAFVVSRGATRSILCRYQGQEEGAVRFATGDNGKPFLPMGGDLRFSLSRTAGVALCAVARGDEVGIDIEQIRPDVDCDHLARCFFSPRESEELRTLPEEQRRTAFFTAWTRKEAFVKATGDGLAHGLCDFTVTVRPGEPARVRDVSGRHGDPTSWSLRTLEVGRSHAATLAVEGPVEEVSGWQWLGP